MDLSDAVAILAFLFRGGASFSCEQAADADGDGALAITDAVRVLGHLFQGGPAPAASFLSCGPAAAGQDLTCLRFVPCE